MTEDRVIEYAENTRCFCASNADGDRLIVIRCPDGIISFAVQPNCSMSVSSVFNVPVALVPEMLAIIVGDPQ